jgi:hypothetical protein
VNKIRKLNPIAIQRKGYAFEIRKIRLSITVITLITMTSWSKPFDMASRINQTAPASKRTMKITRSIFDSGDSSGELDFLGF